jgi:glutamine synthetase
MLSHFTRATNRVCVTAPTLSLARTVPRFYNVQPSRFETAVPDELKDINTHVLDDLAMERILSNKNFDIFMAARRTGEQIPKQVKNEMARDIRNWAQSKGAVGYTHWFSPVRGPNHGTKLETFLQMDFADNNNLAVGLSGTELFMTETDGSSFPNGGLRCTHAAAAFMAWDMSSPPFIYGENLFLPASFVAFTGESLDVKTPLLKASQSLDTQATRLLRLLGDHSSEGVVTNLGWEQEFFILDRETYLQRPDLVATGRTVFGAEMARGQDQSLEYFGKIPTRVNQFFSDIRAQFWKVGISADCFHNEVAPGQHEFAPIFSMTSTAADKNILAMDIMRDTAFEHGLAVLFHEKPFKGINGSGKHNNWGLNTSDTGSNLFVPGKNEYEEKRFVTFVTALCAAIKRHGDLFRACVSTSGNDFRLGAQEAPPAIFTLYVGEGFEKHLRNVAKGGSLLGYTGASKAIKVGKTVNDIAANAEDRNRTAPFPFCGNRFEFRAVGSNQHVAWPMSVLNAAMSNVCRDMADRAEAKGGDIEAVVRETLQEVEGALFSGNGYDAELLESLAEEHNLFHLKTSCDAYATITSPKNVDLFTREGVFTEAEVQAKQNVLYDAFSNEVANEARVALKMLRNGIIPAVLADVQAERATGFASRGLVAKEASTQGLLDATDDLEEAFANVPDGTEAETANYFQNVVRPALENARVFADDLETRVSNFPYPSYDVLLRNHHN